jgi:hypothetical protein
MTDFSEREAAIFVALKRINDDAGAFVTGILTGELTREDQIAFAHRLVDVAEMIRERLTGPFGIVIEGSVTDERTTAARELPGPARDARATTLLR